MLDPHTRKEYYWEHLGKMDDPYYVQKNVAKLREYICAGYLPGRDLLITLETQEQPLDPREIHQILKGIKNA